MLRIRTDRGKVIVGTQCARVGCDEGAVAHLSRREIREKAEGILSEIEDGALEGESSTGAGIADRAEGKVLGKILERALAWTLDQLEEGVDIELPIPWTLAPSAFCGGCSYELLEAAGDDVAAWYDQREEGR